MSKEMGQHIENFKNFLTENSTQNLSEITKFNKLSHEDKIKYLVDNFGMEKVEALEICPDGNTKVSDLPNDIKSQFGKSDVENLNISDVIDSQKVNWDDFIEDLRRDMGSNTSIKTTDFRYLEKWLFNKILNKTIVGDEYWERPNW
jgi:hypothetical protein